MKLEPYLAAHAYLHVQRPPELWEADTDDEPFLRLLGGMIAAGLARGSTLANLVLNVNNVVIEESSADARHPAGQYVAMTIRGAGDWLPEGGWWPHAAGVEGPLASLVSELRAAGAAFAYSRDMQGEGAITVCLPRLGGPKQG